MTGQRNHPWNGFRFSLSLVVGLLYGPFSLAATSPAQALTLIPKGTLPNLTALESCAATDPLATATVSTKAGMNTAVLTLHSAKLRRWTVHQVIPGEVASLYCDPSVTADVLVLTRTGQVWKGRPGQLKRQTHITFTGTRPLLARWFTYAREKGCVTPEWSINGFVTPQDCPPENEMRTHLLLVSTDDDQTHPQTFFQLLDRQGRQVWHLRLRDVRANLVLTSVSVQGEFQVMATAGSLPGSPTLGKHDVILLKVSPIERTSEVLLRVGSEAEDEATLFGFNADLEMVVGGQTNGAVTGRYGGRGDAFLTQWRSGRDWTLQLGGAQAERFDDLFLTGSFYSPMQGFIFGRVDEHPAIWTFKDGTGHFTRVPLPENYPMQELKFFRLFKENALLIIGKRSGKTSWTLFPLNSRN